MHPESSIVFDRLLHRTCGRSCVSTSNKISFPSAPALKLPNINGVARSFAHTIQVENRDDHVSRKAFVVNRGLSESSCRLQAGAPEGPRSNRGNCTSVLGHALGAQAYYGLPHDKIACPWTHFSWMYLGAYHVFSLHTFTASFRPSLDMYAQVCHIMLFGPWFVTAINASSTYGEILLKQRLGASRRETRRFVSKYLPSFFFAIAIWDS